MVQVRSRTRFHSHTRRQLRPQVSAGPRLRRIIAALLLAIGAPAMLGGALGPRQQVIERLLATHNAERARLGLAPLAWDERLADGARDWSDTLARTGRFEHSPNPPGERIGENIWGGTPGAFTPEHMIGRWLQEGSYFRPGVFPANSTTGAVEDVSHYTQIVWRRSRAVGCALSRNAGEEILVCRYSEAGNVIGSRVY